jgi:3-methyladenine DNA glycosylase AlkC
MKIRFRSITLDQPDPLTDIEKYFGEEKAKYVKNKNKGGCNNAKGTNYELHYAIYQIARHAPRVLEQEDEIYIFSQVKEFVDDLQLEYPQKNYKLDFQLKNSKQVSWIKASTPLREILAINKS